MKINSLKQQQMINSIAKERKDLPVEMPVDKVILGSSTSDRVILMGDKIKKLKATGGDMSSALSLTASGIKLVIGLAVGITIGACGGGILARCMGASGLLTAYTSVLSGIVGGIGGGVAGLAISGR